MSKWTHSPSCQPRVARKPHTNKCYAGRFLCGLQVGAVSLLVPRFLTEIAPRRVRGSVGSLSQVLVCGLSSSRTIRAPVV